MDNHADRPEFRQALAGKLGKAVRHSYTLGQDMMYIALPLQDGPEIVGVVRTSIPLTDIDDALATIYRRIVMIALVVSAVAAGIGLAVSRRISRPLAEMERGAERFADGDFG
ncbi:MAG: PAS domain-containing sensor histidine kinase, partial [Armatimonadetes bacterium]|nr:PAS domain-containing sensor histidine kinase [Armatimonadota bacterium]NIN06849.1 PAS domain-containing sensor histidine kinase [Armatimonadota bacterium]NIT32149.1 PAS domain-containing sensor histidine kinase [Armatimonadota bacterium]